MQKALGRFSNLLDVETAFATTVEQKTSALIYLNFDALIPIGVFLTLLIITKKESLIALRNTLIYSCALILSFFVFFLIQEKTINSKIPSISLISFSKTTSDFFHYDSMNNKWVSGTVGNRQVRRKIYPLQNSCPPVNNIVLVIAESIRGDKLSLNGYQRETTPFLKSLKKNNILHNWGIASSASTGSRFSFSAIITGLSPDDFPDKTGYKVNTFPTLFQYAKSIGYKTYFVDGQTNYYWSGTEDDNQYLDNFIGVNDIRNGEVYHDWDIDKHLAKTVNNIISASRGNFIIIFTRGVHIPYHTSFPPSEQKWTPSYSFESKFDVPKGSQIQEAINSYDNGLRYNIDSFFKNLITDYSNIPNNTIVLYTGDHGQTLFENGKASHGGDTFDEANVPLFIIGNLPIDVDTSYKASHQNIYPTILDLMNYPKNQRERTSIPSLIKAKSYDSKPRHFNPNLGKKVSFD